MRRGDRREASVRDGAPAQTVLAFVFWWRAPRRQLPRLATRWVAVPAPVPEDILFSTVDRGRDPGPADPERQAQVPGKTTLPVLDESVLPEDSQRTCREREITARGRRVNSVRGVPKDMS
jgi:hypothetical protein